MKKINIAILGATGAVGTEILNILVEKNINVGTLRLLADKNDAGKIINFKGNDYTVLEANEESFTDIDIMFSAVSDNISKIFTPIAVAKGAIVIDNSNAYRLDPEVPLIIPEVNGDAILGHKGIIANPNCSTIIALIAIGPIYKKNRIKRMIVSTYQAVSGAGIAGIKELNDQVKAVINNEEVKINVFPHQIAFNVIPQIDSFCENGYTKEELKLVNESRKILNDEDLKITCTCVRVPIYRSHSESINIETENKMTVKEVEEILLKADGIKYVNDPKKLEYPIPIDSSGQDLVFVGRVREDFSQENSFNLWCCGDQIRKGAASNAVQISELLINKNLV